MKISSRVHTVNSIIVPVLLVLFFALIGIMITFISYEDVKNGKVDSIFKTPIYGSLILFVVIIGTAIHFIKMYKAIQIDKKGIKISNLFQTKFIPWSEIKMIELTGKSTIANSPLDATILKLKNGRKIELIASRYENMPTIRKTLEQVIELIDTQKPLEINPIKEPSKVDSIGYVDQRKMTKYSDNHILSFNGILIYGWIAFSIYALTILSYSGAILIAVTFMFGFIYGFLGLQLHYFFLDTNYLVVRNHVWPWVNDKYKVENIKEVILEHPYKRSTSMRVSTKDYKSKLYSGGSLKNSTWKMLLQDIKNLNINTKNEGVTGTL